MHAPDLGGPSMERHDIIILGAGLSGLSAALHVGGDFLVLEREDRPGGLTRTEEMDGFLFNHTGHWLHLRDDRVRALVADLLPGRLLTIARRAKVYTHGVFTDYPFQANLCGLPPAVLRECLQGAVEAAMRRAASRRPPRLRTFLDYVRFHFGDGIARHFIVPYNTKLWGVPPDEVTAEWTQRFVPVPDIGQIVDGAIGWGRGGSTQDKTAPHGVVGYNATFLYPAEGGIEALPRAMAARLPRDRLLLNAEVTEVHSRDRVIAVGPERFRYEHLVSTLPLPDLVDRTTDAPPAVRRAASRLRCAPLRYMNVALAVDRPLNGAHWVYLPEPHLPFYRVGSASNAVASLAPPGRSSLYVELANDRRLSERDAVCALAAFLKEIGTIHRESDILFAAFREHPYGYVIYDRHCARARAAILSHYASLGIHSIGRYGAWTYNSMEDAILDGMSVARHIRGF